MRPTAAILIAATLAWPLATPARAGAQPTRARTATPAAAAAAKETAKEAAPEPQQTTATFGDWTLRCTHGAAAQTCEVTQGVNNQERPFAQVAIGRPAKGQPLQMAVLVPPSVTLAHPAALMTGNGSEPAVLEMAWRRCLPGGCMAESLVSADQLKHIRGWAEPARIVFADGTGRAVALPFSSKGLAQALDALSKEDPE